LTFALHGGQRSSVDLRDVMRPFPAELMRMWPISTRVNKPENDDPSMVEPIQVSTNAA
jgi:putative SOS response-associated peptidase YedK